MSDDLFEITGKKLSFETLCMQARACNEDEKKKPDAPTN